MSTLEVRSWALVEYVVGTYPKHPSPHGNAIHHDTPYTRTNPKVLAKIDEIAKEKTPREIYKIMTLEDSFEAPKDFKECRNVKYQQQKEPEAKGKRSNLADEILECVSLVNSHDFVQQYCQVKGKMPNLICFTDHQKIDLKYFLSQKTGYPLAGCPPVLIS